MTDKAIDLLATAGRTILDAIIEVGGKGDAAAPLWSALDGIAEAHLILKGGTDG